MSSFFLPNKPAKSDKKRKKQLNVRWVLIRRIYFNISVKKKRKIGGALQKKKLAEEIGSDSDVEE